MIDIDQKAMVGDMEMIIIRGPIASGKTSISKMLNSKLANSSVIETDAIKRMIDPCASSDWRREVAVSTSAFLAGQLLRVGRRVIAEVHANRPEQAAQLKCIARDYGVAAVSYLVRPPLQVCLERAADRYVPGISYAIDEAMVRDYYLGIVTDKTEREFDSSKLSTQEITDEILSDITGTI